MPPRTKWASLFKPAAFTDSMVSVAALHGGRPMPQHTRPVFSAAIRVDPEPRKGSRTISPRFVRSISASCSIAVGFTVG